MVHRLKVKIDRSDVMQDNCMSQMHVAKPFSIILLLGLNTCRQMPLDPIMTVVGPNR